MSEMTAKEMISTAKLRELDWHKGQPVVDHDPSKWVACLAHDLAVELERMVSLGNAAADPKELQEQLSLADENAALRKRVEEIEEELDGWRLGSRGFP